MGVSTSGSFVVVGVALFLAMSSMYGTYTNTMERMDESMEMAQERRLATAHTGVNITQASYSSNELTVELHNTGETTVSVTDTDVLVDGEYVALSEFETREIETKLSTRDITGRDAPRLRPNETLRLVDTDRSSAPDRTKLVVEYGIADTKLVS